MAFSAFFSQLPTRHFRYHHKHIPLTKASILRLTLTTTVTAISNGNVALPVVIWPPSRLLFGRPMAGFLRQPPQSPPPCHPLLIATGESPHFVHVCPVRARLLISMSTCLSSHPPSPRPCLPSRVCVHWSRPIRDLACKTRDPN